LWFPDPACDPPILALPPPRPGAGPARAITGPSKTADLGEQRRATCHPIRRVSATSHDFGGTMSVKRLLIAALVALAMLAASALSQERTDGHYRPDLRQRLGCEGRQPRQQQPALRERAELRCELRMMGNTFAHVTFEVPVVVNWDQNLQFDGNVMPGNDRSYFVTPSLRANAFATTGVSPGSVLGAGSGGLVLARNGNSAGRTPTADRRPGCSRWGLAWM
jgi:hypothetical protein